MNKRIKEIIQEAWANAGVELDGTSIYRRTKVKDELFIKFFAYLIVKDCLDIVYKYRRHKVDVTDKIMDEIIAKLGVEL